MSKFKKLSLFCLSFVLALTFLIGSFPSKITNQKTNAAATTSEVTVIDQNVLNYVQISIAGKNLTIDNFNSVDTNSDGKADTSYITTKDSTSLTFNPLKYSYIIEDFESGYYEKTTISSEPIIKNTETNLFPTTFVLNGTEYNYKVSDSGVISIAPKNSSAYIIQTSDFAKLVEHDENTKQLIFTVIYTLKPTAPDTDFKFKVSTTDASKSTTTYSLDFLRPVLDFSSKNIAYFTFFGGDVGNETFVEEDIKDDLSYEDMKIEFQNNDYTEFNPLYFNINHNGFVYTFTLYSKKIGTYEYLFVEYFDEQRASNPNTSLATQINTSNGTISSAVYKYKDDSKNDFNKFTIHFNKTGRYEIEMYDNTYLLLKNQQTASYAKSTNDNSINYNYDKFSFYIKTKEDTSTGSSSAYDNAYAIMQNYDDEGNFLDYIVSESTQNNNVQITIKNLKYYFEKDEIISSTTEDELDEMNVIKFTKSTLSGSTNIPDERYYSVSDIKKLFEDIDDEEKNLVINCTDDAIYALYIYRFTRINGEIVKLSERRYQFTIVKQPKISFTVKDVDKNYDPIINEKTKEYSTTLHEASTPYKTVAEQYKINIDSSISLSFFFTKDNYEKEEELKKTYLNQYTVLYAMQAVLIEQVPIYDENSTNGDELNVLGLKFYGVGDITVTVTFNSQTTTYNVQSGSTLVFEDFGVYSISIKDSMGTIGTATFNFKKPVSISATILVILVIVIAVVIVFFVISSRGKVSTR